MRCRARCRCAAGHSFLHPVFPRAPARRGALRLAAAGGARACILAAPAGLLPPSGGQRRRWPRPAAAIRCGTANGFDIQHPLHPCIRFFHVFKHTVSRPLFRRVPSAVVVAVPVCVFSSSVASILFLPRDIAFHGRRCLRRRVSARFTDHKMTVLMADERKGAQKQNRRDEATFLYYLSSEEL